MQSKGVKMKTTLKGWLIGGLLAGLLESCFMLEPEQLNFDTDPRILRGTWQGTYQEDNTYNGAAEEAIKLVLNARYLNEHEYAVSGTLYIRTETLTLEGTMNGGDTQLYAQMPPPRPAVLEARLKDAAGREVGTLSLNSQPDYHGSLEVVGKTRGFFTIKPQ
jgi:hypothetical protein